MIEILSNDGGSVALLRRGKIYKIGQVSDGFIMTQEGKKQPCRVLTWEFFEDGETDNFFYSESGKLIFSAISNNRPNYILREYEDLVSKGASLNIFVNVIQSVFITTELGFGDNS